MSSQLWPSVSLDRRQREPLYRQLADALLAYIREQDVPPDCPLPSESALMEQYGLSRMTVRQAVGRLVAEGWVRTIQGKGSFTTRPLVQVQRPFWRVATQNAWFEPPAMESELLDASACPATSLLRDMFDLGELESTYRVRWLKRLEGATVGLETRYFPPHIAAAFGDTLHGADPASVLATSTRTSAARVRVALRVTLPTDFETAHLGLEPDVHVFTVQSTFYGLNGRANMTGQSLYRLDLFALDYDALYEA